MSHEAKDGRGGRRGRSGGAAREFGVESLERRELRTGNVISGFVYNDANGNGRFDPGEAPIANSPIQLRNASNVVVGSTRTDANGAYQFSSDSTVSTAPTTLTRTLSFPKTSTNYTLSGTVPRFDPTLGTLTSVDVIHSGTMTSHIQVENRDPSPSTIVGTIDGTLTARGPGVSGLTIRPKTTESFAAGKFDGVVDYAGTSGKDFGSVPATSTNSETLTTPSDLSAYVGTGSVIFTEAGVSNSFAAGGGNLASMVSTSATSTINVVYHDIPQNNLKPGPYTIVQTADPAGYADGIDSRGGVPLPNSVGSDVIPVTLAGADLPSNNFGEWRPNGLSGFVYLDANNDGVKGPHEFGIAQAVVNLTGVAASGATVNLTAKTADDGSYQFANLRDGQYTVSLVQPPAFATGRDTIGSQGGRTTLNQFSEVPLRGGTLGVNNNFGERMKPDCKLEGLLARVAHGLPINASTLGPKIHLYLPGLVTYAQEHPRGASGRFGS